MLINFNFQNFSKFFQILVKNKIAQRKEIIIKFQSNCRRFIIARKYREKISALTQLKKLASHLKTITDLITKIKDKNVQKAESESVSKMLSDMNNLKTLIKGDKIADADINIKLDAISNAINERISTLKSKIKQEIKMMEMEEVIRKERQKKEEEERKRKEEEEMKRRKMELEKKFQEENSQSSASQSSASQLLASQSSASAKDQEDKIRQINLMNQQELLDHDLALRIASGQSVSSKSSSNKVDFGCQVSPVLPPKILPPPSEWPVNGNNGQDGHQPNRKYDLSKWKYSELRDTINTSCDIELLEECREEFHRRLKVYHEWKAKQASNTMNGVSMSHPSNPFADHEVTRVPPSIMESVGKNGGVGTMRRVGGQNGGGHKLESRYFRIPFVRPSVMSGPKGWWFAHFEGQWIARQMELHPEKLPILLVAGKDDMQMCELSLEETRLTTKRGAEILPEEFEAEWIKNGGAPWKGSVAGVGGRR